MYREATGAISVLRNTWGARQLTLEDGLHFVLTIALWTHLITSVFSPFKNDEMMLTSTRVTCAIITHSISTTLITFDVSIPVFLLEPSSGIKISLLLRWPFCEMEASNRGRAPGYVQ